MYLVKEVVSRDEPNGMLARKGDCINFGAWVKSWMQHFAISRGPIGEERLDCKKLRAGQVHVRKVRVTQLRGGDESVLETVKLIALFNDGRVNDWPGGLIDI